MISKRLDIVIRTKNSERTIESAIISVLNQSYPIGNIIIVDSGSSDSTLKIVEKYAKCKVLAYPVDLPFNYSKSLNLGCREVNTDFIGILSSHSIYNIDNTIELMVEMLHSDSNIVGVSLNKQKERNDSEISTLEAVDVELLSKENFRGYALSNVASMIRKASWEAYNFNEQIPTCEDVDWSCHFFELGKKIARFNNVSVEYKNPYHSMRKDINELVFISRKYYPRIRKIKSIKNLIINSLKLYVRKDFSSAKFYFLYAYYLLTDRIFKRHIPTTYVKKRS